MKNFQRYLKIYLIVIAFSVALNAQSKDVQKMLDAAYANGEFSGVVLVSKNNKIVFKGAVGEANRVWKIPNTVSTKFRICSVTKQFTAMLVMQLVEQGKVNLDSIIADYLPEFRKETAQKVSIRNLLLSASGLPVLPDEFYTSENAKITDAEYVIKNYLQGDLAFEPGEKFNYNNADFIILGRIVEKVSGKSYEENLSEKILAPLGMKNTGLIQNKNVVRNFADGYSFKDGAFFNERTEQIQNYGAAGAMYSTAEDLSVWNDALLNYRLLSKKATEEMFTPSPKLGFVGLGSWIYDLEFAGGKTRRMIERQGYINGFNVANIISFDEKISAVFISNVENTEKQTLFRTYGKTGLTYDVLNELFKEKK